MGSNIGKIEGYGMTENESLLSFRAAFIYKNDSVSWRKSYSNMYGSHFIIDERNNKIPIVFCKKHNRWKCHL